MSDNSKMKKVCADCQKEIEGFPYSLEAYLPSRSLASLRKSEGVLGYQCASCGAVYCSDCGKSVLKKSGWTRTRCPKCENLFGPGGYYCESEPNPEEIQKAIKHLVQAITYTVDKKSVPLQADALTEFGEPGIDALLSLVNPEGKNLSMMGFTEAARVLANRGEPRAIKRFESILVGGPNVTDSLRMICADHLAELDPIGAAKLLGDILVNEKESMEVRQKSAQVLGTLRRPESILPLNQVLGGLKGSRAGLVAAAAEALGNIGHSRSVEPLIAALNISNPEAKAIIAEALGKLSDPKAVEPLKKNLGASHQGLREATAKALKNLNWLPADEKEQIVLDRSLPVEKDRFCFSCDKPVGDAKACPHCRADLTSKPYSSAVASVLGYLFGGLMGGVGLLIVMLVEAIARYKVDMPIRMLVFAVLAIAAWKGMKTKLSTPRDLAILKPKQRAEN